MRFSFSTPPVSVIPPLTSNFVAGVDVPMPTFPSVKNVTLST